MKTLTFVYHYHSSVENERSQVEVCNWQDLTHSFEETYWWLKLGDVVHLFDNYASFLDFVCESN